MLTIFVGTQFDLATYIVDGSNNPVDISLATSITLNIGNLPPIIGVATQDIGYVIFPLPLSATSAIGTFDTTITYTLGAITETTFKTQTHIIQRPLVANTSVISGAKSTVLVELQDTDGTSLDITNSTVQLFDKPAGTAAAVLYQFSVINAKAGIVSIDYTQTVRSYSYFLVDGIMTSEFLVNPVV